MIVHDFAVIGGGASGMFAACTYARLVPEASVLLLEAADRIGKKLLKTGNGQGNLTCHTLDVSRYHGEHPEFCRPALSAFDNGKVREAFLNLGLFTAEEEDRVFPFSRQAGSIVDVLRLELGRRNVRIRTDFPVARVLRKQYFELSSPGRETFYARSILLATGGKASPTSPAYASGYEIARSFGHRITPLFPSLVQLRADMSDSRVLQGVKADVRLRCCDASSDLFSGTGELLFCDYGLSGKIIFAASSYLSGKSFSGTEAHVDFLPGFDSKELFSVLAARRKALPHLPCDSLLLGIAKSQIARAVLARAGLPHVPTIAHLSEAELERVARLCNDYVFRLTGLQPFDCAQVTRGGVCTDGVDPVTLESRLVPGLYFSGELLDIDGDCGGFNLQWCWSSADAAARAAAGRTSR